MKSEGEEAKLSFERTPKTISSSKVSKKLISSDFTLPKDNH